MPGNFALSRNCWENFNKYQFDGIGKYDIPPIKGVNVDNIEDIIGFNYVKGCTQPENKAVHFFLDDYQFMRVWTLPEGQIKTLKQFKYVCSPDFSIYTDFPKALQIYSHYKKHWCARLWEENGIKVIPTIGWGDEQTYDWCFDGEPIGSTIAVSSVGTQSNSYSKLLFIKGYQEMCDRLKPDKIIFYGNIPKECTGNIVQIKPFTEKWRVAKMEVM